MAKPSQIEAATARLAAAIVDPAVFARDILNLSFEKFHGDWFNIQRYNRRSLILAPRGHGKTTVCTIVYALWRILADPDVRILVVSNTAAQSYGFTREIQQHLLGDTLRNLLGDPRGDKWTEMEFVVAGRKRIAKEATVTALGVLGPMVGKHFDVIILDDVVNEDNVTTPLQRDKVDNWFRKVLLPCLEPDGSLHLIGTRYHHDDLYGRIIAREQALRANKRREYYVHISRALDGDSPLWPEAFDCDALEALRREMGSALFGLQFQNDASLARGALIRPEWVRYHDGAAPDDGYTVAAFDLAISQKETADYFAWALVRRCGADYYVLDAGHKRITFDAQARFIRQMWERRHPERLRVEVVAYQEALAQHLAARGLPIERVKPHKDKVRRLQRVQPLFENGQVYIPHGLNDLEDELFSFPYGAHDDIVDALEMALSGAMRSRVSRKIFGPDIQ